MSEPATDLVSGEGDVLLLGDRPALWLADEVAWVEFIASTYCVPCEGRGYYVVGRRSGQLSFPTCYHCGGEGRPRCPSEVTP